MLPHVSIVEASPYGLYRDIGKINTAVAVGQLVNGHLQPLKWESCRVFHSLIFPNGISDQKNLLTEIALYICFATLLITHITTS